MDQNVGTVHHLHPEEIDIPDAGAGKTRDAGLDAASAQTAPSDKAAPGSLAENVRKNVGPIAIGVTVLAVATFIYGGSGSGPTRKAPQGRQTAEVGDASHSLNNTQPSTAGQLTRPGSIGFSETGDVSSGAPTVVPPPPLANADRTAEIEALLSLKNKPAAKQAVNTAPPPLPLSSPLPKTSPAPDAVTFSAAVDSNAAAAAEANAKPLSPVPDAPSPPFDEPGMNDQVAAPIVEAPMPTTHSAVLPLPADTTVAAAAVTPRPDLAGSVLRARPMAPVEEVQVLQLVTQLATMVRDQKVEIATMHDEQHSFFAKVMGTIQDFTRRISLSEARGALSSAMGIEPRVLPAPQAAPVAVLPLPRVIARHGVPAVSQAVSVDAALHSYHVKAASPGLAMVAELDATGADGPMTTLVPGTTLPGFGKVTSIGQRGTTWTVVTEHGLIQ